MPLTFLRCLNRLASGEELKASEIAAKSLLGKFIDDGLIKERAVSKRRREYVCVNADNLHNYLHAQYEILSLESYIHQMEGQESDGQQSLQATKSTKIFRKSGLQGFFIKAYGTSLFIDDEEIKSLPNGIELFIHQPEKLKLLPSALVVGVENPECFVKFTQLRELFPKQELIVVMRYMSKSPNKWLQSIPNSYLHFGDFDPAGISIYIHEYRKQLSGKRCNFFIPDNIDYLIKQYGSKELYDRQINQLTSIKKSEFTELESLIEILHKYNKGMEQERLLTF